MVREPISACPTGARRPEGRADWRVRVGNKCPGPSGLTGADWRGICRTGPRQRHRGGTVILMMWGYGAGWGWGAWLTMGIGMILVTAPDRAESVIDELAARGGRDARAIGEVVAGEPPSVSYINL